MKYLLPVHLTWILSSLVSRHQPEPTHSCPEQKSAFVSVSLSFSVCLTCGSTWQYFSSRLSLCFQRAYFGLLIRKKLVLPQTHFQNKGLEGVTT